MLRVLVSGGSVLSLLFNVLSFCNEIQASVVMSFCGVLWYAYLLFTLVVWIMNQLNDAWFSILRLLLGLSGSTSSHRME